jgi:histidinol dehydrogenase
MALFQILRAGSAPFDERLSRLERRGDADLETVEAAVRDILASVKKEGDAAVRRYVERFEKRTVKDLLIRDYGGAEALESIATPVREALLESAARVRRYHERQFQDLVSFEYE